MLVLACVVGCSRSEFYRSPSDDGGRELAGDAGSGGGDSTPAAGDTAPRIIDWTATLTEQKVPPPTVAAGAFGSAVALDADWALIGAPAAASGAGAASVARRSDSWAVLQALTYPGAGVADSFGASVAIAGAAAVVGAPFYDGGTSRSGALVIFERTGATWGSPGPLQLQSPSINDRLGTAAAVSGSILLGGTDHAGGSHGNAAFPFTATQGSWTERSPLVAADRVGDAGFGLAVAVSGNVAVVGAYRDERDGVGAGAAYVSLTTDGGATWQTPQRLEPGDAAAGHGFGTSVAVAGDVAAVGAYGAFGAGRGAVYVFRRDGSLWPLEQKVLPAAPDDWAYFGTSVSLDGDVLAVGAYWERSAANGAGAAYVFRFVGGTWVEQQKVVAGDADADDHFGTAVAISGDTLLVGAPGDDAAGADAGAVYFLRAPAR